MIFSFVRVWDSRVGGQCQQWSESPGQDPRGVRLALQPHVHGKFSSQVQNRNVLCFPTLDHFDLIIGNNKSFIINFEHNGILGEVIFVLFAKSQQSTIDFRSKSFKMFVDHKVL